jgi:hypothetical protein
MSQSFPDDAPHAILGRVLGPVRRRGWVRSGLTVHLAKYDRATGIGDVGCYHVLRGDGRTLCGRATDRPHWRDAGWADSEVICCKHCADHVWRRWRRDGACDGVDQDQGHTVADSDNWPAHLDDAGRRAPSAFLDSQRGR